MMMRLDANAPVSCSLNDVEFVERRSLAWRTLIPHVKSVERLDNGVLIRFKADSMLNGDIEAFVLLERQCCGFLKFTITPEDNPEYGATKLQIEGPAEAGATIEMFAQASLSEST